MNAHRGRTGARPPSHGFTLVEILVVLMLVGLAFALAAPAYLSPRRTPDDGAQRVIDAARRTAVSHAEALTLAVEPDGRWVIVEGGALGAASVRAGTLDWPAAVALRVNISPLGACTLEATRHTAAAFAIDPVRCRLQRL